MIKTRFCLALICLLLAACQTQRERFTSLWSSSEVTDDASTYPNDYNNLMDVPLGQTHNPAQADAPNKLLTMTDVSGNREYLFLDSISQERGILTALIEFRYVKPQTLPANGMTYHYNQWREQIDCKNKVRILRTTTHYNMAGEIVDTRDYPLPKYKPAELAALSQPNDKVIQHVCEKTGATGLAVGDAAVATTTDTSKTDNKKINKNNKDKSVEKTTEKSTDTNTEKTNTKTKKGKGKEKEEEKIKVDEKIDFINKGKAEAENKTDATPSKETPSVKSDKAVDEQKADDKASEKVGKSSKNKKTKTDKKTAKKIEPEKTVEPTRENDSESIEGEKQLKPI